jgi:preprotein translocase subunit SecE
MARQTRQQRRARRREQEASRATDGSAAQRAVPRQPAAAHAAEAGRPVAAPRGRGGFLTFIAECVGELKKVDWPNQRQVLTGTIAVLIACAIVGAYLYGADLVFRPFVERVLIGR